MIKIKKKPVILIRKASHHLYPPVFTQVFMLFAMTSGLRYIQITLEMLCVEAQIW